MSLNIYENKVLKRIFGCRGNEETRGWRLHNYKCINNMLHLAQGNMDFTFLRGPIKNKCKM